MAASTIPAPGTKLGPCDKDCKHRDCARNRQDAKEVCRFCRKAIGFGVRYYTDPEAPTPTALVHAACLKDAPR